MARAFRQPLTCPVVVGRQEQLATIDRYLQAACGGRGQVLLIAGEAGTGKSRLIAEASI
jgi:predicted ATPase